MTYGKWIWGIVILLVLMYAFNIMGFKDTVKGWFGGSATAEEA